MTLNIQEIIDNLKLNNYCVIPTDTIPGICIPLSEKNIYKLHNAKRRPLSKPLSLLLPNKEDIDNFCHLNDFSREVVDLYLPGPTTVILPTYRTSSLFKNYFKNKIGIRIIKDEPINTIVQSVGPLLLTSINKSGCRSLHGIEEIEKIFGLTIPILDYKYEKGKPSMIIEVIGGKKAVVLRDREK